jgi:CRP-like cAMP-binding protein
MGNAASVGSISPVESSSGDNLSSGVGTGPRVSSGQIEVKRRSTLFVNNHRNGNGIDDTLSLDLSAAYHDEDSKLIDTDDQELIKRILGPFFFSDKEEASSIRLMMLVNFMKRESVKKGAILMSEGDAATKLYLMSAGSLEVSVDGEPIRLLSRGALVGELALLYNCSRSAHVKCMANCEFWTLNKACFDSLMSIASPSSPAQRGRWLSESPELNALGSVAVSVLVGNLESSRLDVDRSLYTLDEKSSRCILIESGRAVIKLPPDLVGLPAEEIDKRLGILRPVEGRRKDWREVDMSYLVNFLSNVDTKPAMPCALVEAQPEPRRATSKKEYHTVHEGCILGLGVLFGKAGMPFREQAPEYEWKWEKNGGPSSLNSVDSLQLGEKPAPRKRSISYSSMQEDGALAPYSVTVQSSKLTYSYFTCDKFVDLFGGLPGLLRSLVKRSTKLKTVRQTTMNRFFPELLGMKELERKFVCNNLSAGSHDDFQPTSVIAVGTKSTILLAYLKDDKSEKPTEYALKIMSKSIIIDKGLLRHTMDECKLLSACHSPFVASFACCYQTEREIVLCMEPVYHGDLYSIATERSRGMSLDMVRFYAAQIVMALSHIHSKGIAYRGLHSENVMIDRRGYIRVVDFAFAKQIPYLSTDITGYVKIMTKSFTTCGTAEYMAPECIFNTGANHAVDIWALGILLHELHTQTTPFKVRENMSEMDILQTVAATKVSAAFVSCIVLPCLPCAPTLFCCIVLLYIPACGYLFIFLIVIVSVFVFTYPEHWCNT